MFDVYMWLKIFSQNLLRAILYLRHKIVLHIQQDRLFRKYKIVRKMFCVNGNCFIIK